MLKQTIRKWSSLDVLSGIGILLFIVGCPYFLRDRYFSMTLAKTFFFYGSSALFAVVCLIERRALRKRVKIPLIRKNRTELYFLLFIALAFVSCVLAVSPGDAITGATGRNMGMLMFLCIFLAYVFVSRFGQFKTPVAVVFGVSVFVMNLIAFLQFCRLDPFGLYEGTKDSVKTGFMSLLGNKDVYYSYLSMATPFALYLIFEAQELWEKIFWYAVGFSCFIGIIVCNCEGGYLCLAASFLFFLLAKCGDNAQLRTVLRIFMLFFAAGLLISLLKFNFKKGHILEDLMTRLLIRPLVCGPALAVTTGLYAVLLKKELPAKGFPILKKVVAVVLAVCIVLFAAAFVYFTFINPTVDIGKFSRLLRFDDSWGSGRGEIWRQMATIFARQPLLRKLFGAGQESVAALVNRYFPAEASASAKVLDNAHNEYLHYLVTHGLLGLAAYLLFAVSALRRGFKEGGRYQRAAALGAVCYMVQAAFNLLQALTTPMFFVFLALTQTRDLEVPPKTAAGPDQNALAAPADDADAAGLPQAGENAAGTQTAETAADAMVTAALSETASIN